MVLCHVLVSRRYSVSLTWVRVRECAYLSVCVPVWINRIYNVMNEERALYVISFRPALILTPPLSAQSGVVVYATNTRLFCLPYFGLRVGPKSVIFYYVMWLKGWRLICHGGLRSCTMKNVIKEYEAPQRFFSCMLSEWSEVETFRGDNNHLSNSENTVAS